MSTPPSALDEFFAHCPAAFFAADREGALQKLSRRLARLLGLEAQEGTKLSDRVHADDRLAFAAAWATLGESAEPVPFRFRLREAQGSYRLVSCTAERSESSGDVHGWIEEVSKDAVQARLLRALQENAPIAITMLDRKGVYLYVEGRGLAASGIEPGQLIGTNAYEVLVGDDDAIADLRRVLAGEISHAYRRMSDTQWDMWGIPFRDERGEVEGAVSLAFELSQGRQAERELSEKLALIERQQQVIRSLSTPIIEVWDKVLTLPMVGVVDSIRAAEVMDNLLRQVSQKGARFAILDLTGIEAVDTETASHLLKMIQALRLLGAEGIITGLQPIVAQTMVSLGMDLGEIVTLATLRSALRYCMKRLRGGGSPASGGE